LASGGLDGVPRGRKRLASGFFRAIAALGFGGSVVIGGCGTLSSSKSALVTGGDASAGGTTLTNLGGDASGCQPGAVDTYVPGAYQPASGAWQGTCVVDGEDLISEYYDACFGDGATTAACDAFKAMSAASAACAACIVTPIGASRLGPIIDYGGFVGKNTAGCVELVEPGGMPCATEVQALTGCELLACQANCPVSNAATLDDYYDCAETADDAGCARYAAAAACDQQFDGGAASFCTSPAFKDFYDAVVPLFCGQRATYDVDGSTVYTSFTDAGDAGSDATTLEGDAALSSATAIDGAAPDAAADAGAE
jgi:hypothetical protein